MKVITHKLPYTGASSQFALWFLTDLHLGAAACDEKLLQAHINEIAADDNARWIGGGDFIDCIARVGDKRYDEDAMAGWVRGKKDVVGLEARRFVELVTPIAHKCLGMVEGNHERTAITYYDRNIYGEMVADVAKAAGKEAADLALGVHGFLKLQFRRHNATGSSGQGWHMLIYTHHGAGGGSMPGGHALSLGRVLGSHDCDLALLGHRHVEAFVSLPALSVVGSRVVKRNRVGMYVASYLDSHIEAPGMPRDTYPELKGLPSLTLGSTPVLVNPSDREFYVVFSGGGRGAGRRRPTLTTAIAQPVPEPPPPTPPTSRARDVVPPHPLELLPHDKPKRAPRKRKAA